MRVYVFRHGKSEYKQGRVSISEANDLTPDGIETVRNSTNCLSSRISKDVSSGISSSPLGRCLHTSNIIRQTLSEKGFRTHEIEVDDILGEENLDWDLFEYLVGGGEVEYEGENFFVDKTLTNPRGVSSTRYFREDLANKLSEEARKTLPAKYLERIALFETHASVSGRLEKKLNSLNGHDEDMHIIATHEGLTGKFIEQLSGNIEACLSSGKYLVVKNKEGIWVPDSYQDGAISIE